MLPSKRGPLRSHLSPFVALSFEDGWEALSNILDLLLNNQSEEINYFESTQIVYNLCSQNKYLNNVIQKVQEKFDNYFHFFLTSSLSPYDKESEDVDELAKEYILKTGEVMPKFNLVINGISSIFTNIQSFRENFDFLEKFRPEFISILDGCNCYDYIFFSITKLFDVFLNSYNIETISQEPLFQSVLSSKELISYASSQKIPIIKEMLIQQSQNFFNDFVSYSYQQIIPPSFGAISEEDNQETKNSAFSGAFHTISEKKGFDSLFHIIHYLDEAIRLVELEYHMAKEFIDVGLAKEVQNEALCQLSDPDTKTMKFCLSQTHLFLISRDFKEFEKFFNISKQSTICVEILTQNICDQILKEPRTIDKLPEVISFYTQIEKLISSTKREFTKFSKLIRRPLSKLVNTDSEAIMKGLLKTINTAANTNSDIQSLLPIISLFQMKSEFILMHMRHASRRLIQNRNSQIDNEIEIFDQLKTVNDLQVDSLKYLLNDAKKSLQDNRYGPVLIVNATNWPYKPPFPSPIFLGTIATKIKDSYKQNNPNSELVFPINSWIVNVKDTISGTIYNGTGVQAEVFLYFNNHKVITDTALEPRINQSVLAAALKAMSAKAAPALVAKDNAFTLNDSWRHDDIVKLVPPSYKDEIQNTRNSEKSKGDMIEACIVKRLKEAKILQFADLEDFVRSELSSRVSISKDEIRKHVDLLINRGYIEEMESGRLAYIS